MRQRAMLTAATAAVVFAALGLIVPVAGSNARSAPADVVDAELDGLPTATDAAGDPVTDAPARADSQSHPPDGGDSHERAWPRGAAGGTRSEPVDTPIAYSMAAFAVPEGAGVSFRSRSGDDAWGAWHPVPVTPDEAPDPGTDEAQRNAAGANRAFSEPVWVGEADQLQVRVDGAAPEAVGVHLIDSLGHNRSPGEQLSDAVQTVAQAVTGGGQPAAAAVDQPSIVTRSEWGADESKRSGSPQYSDSGVKAGVMHHTVTGNDYDRSDAAAVVRGIYHYHTQTRGWDDIGYNFLVDRFGQIYQGRAGGVEEPVIGAHAAGVNSETTGVAFMGTHHRSGAPLPSEAETSAVELLQWLFDVHHIDAEADVTVDGRSVPALIGHGDVGSTDCPGAYVRDRLDAVRDAVADGQVPMFTAPAESATQLSVGEETGISAGLKPAGEWELTITSQDGGTVLQERGQGEEAAVTWAADEAGAYEWELTSPDRRPVRREIGVMDEVAELVGGHGPMEGSIELSRLAFPETTTATATHAVVARSDVFADAMAGGPLAGPHAPLMLTPSDALDQDVAAELVRVLPDGKTVYVLGGEAAIDEAVVEDLEMRWDVQRLAGRERTETAARIAEEVADRSGTDRVMLARSAPDGINPWADALAGSGWGAREGVPVLLTPPHALTTPVEEALDRFDETIVLGGTEAISSDVADQVPAPRRISGGDRASTAVAIAEQLWGRTDGADGDAFVLGAGWHDQAWQRALASAPLAAQADAPLLLTAPDHVPPVTADYLDGLGYDSGDTARGWMLQHGPIIDADTQTELNLLMQ